MDSLVSVIKTFHPVVGLNKGRKGKRKDFNK